MRLWPALLLVGISACALADPGLLATAEHATAVGDYRLAADSYEQVIAQRGYSAPALFNLGNEWLRLGKPARAILDYERALVLAPGNPAIESNLAVAQQRVGITPPPVGPWLAAARYFSFDTYAWAALGAVWVLCAALILLAVKRRAGRVAGPLVLLSALTLCVSADAAVLCWSDLYRAVVQAPAILHLAPADSAAASGAVREGEGVWIENRYGDFTRIRTADGRSGWVSSTAAVPVRTTRR